MMNNTLVLIELINLVFNLIILLASVIGITFAIRMIRNIKSIDDDISVDTGKISLENNDNLKSISNDIELFIELNKNLIDNIFEEVADDYLSKHDFNDKKTFTVSSLNNLTLKASRTIYSKLSEELDNDPEIIKEFENAEDIVESAYFNMIIKQRFTEYFKAVKKCVMSVGDNKKTSLSNKAGTSKLKVNINSDTVKDSNGGVHLTNIFEGNHFYD